ncbi:hypothetical protein [Marivirga sp.]|uniref:hypothetical protein n=1 Tax=Marivirga sp. TaxID=2018662 RepID=UPI002D7F4F55|nr:hypothetical protein [Marivirga sp.]HET8861505.1 hypothetical protein [Marivirga sp.]
MTGGYKTIIFLFLSFWIYESKAQEYDFSINWAGEEAISLTVNTQEFSALNVRLQGKNQKITGAVSAHENTQFTPYFPFSIGATYEVFDGEKLLFSFTPQKELKSPEVKNVFPLADELPENFLKFYIRFDQPMATGHVYDYLQLLSDAKEIENALIPLKPELWDANKQLLTVWIDPGRIKRDLGPNIKYGAVLEAGNRYQLVVRKGLKAANGANLEKSFLKSFKVIPRDEKIPSLDDWYLKTPSKNTIDSLSIKTQEAVDYTSHLFMTIYCEGQQFEGEFIFVSDTQISFVPEKEWSEGEYKLRVASKAEDLAGNNLNRPFDLDLQEQATISEQEFYEISFKIL